MKKFALIVAMIGAFLVLLSIALNSWSINKDQKKRVSESLEKARAAKAKKAAEQAAKDIQEEYKETTNGSIQEQENR